MKLIVVSNRLPITVTRGTSEFNYKKSSGGLVTGIESLSKHMNFIWIGNISEMSLTKEDTEVVTRDCWNKFHSIPIFIDKETNDLCYNGFCNAILWPALHSFPDDVCFSQVEYAAYKKYNNIFAEEILKTATTDDIVWVHDYHLMLLPELLKKANPKIRVMFFLHIPFCDKRLLYVMECCKRDIINGIAASDVIAFHMPEYALNFRAAAITEGFDVSNRVHAIPIGIDPEMFRKCLKESATAAKIDEFKKMFKGKKIVLGVDRTDYIKGLPLKMKGFQRFLQRNPEMINKSVLVQIAIPSRQDVREYSSYAIKTYEMVSEINSMSGNICTTPVHLLFNSVNFNELCAIYSISDIMLITSVLDGMNLVALEYVACQDSNYGVVVLSKFTGASATLQGALEHNPNNTEEIAEAIEAGLKLPPEERKRRHEINKRNVDIFTSVRWAEDNLGLVYKDWRKEITTDVNEDKNNGG